MNKTELIDAMAADAGISLPSGLIGLLIAVIFSAAMSSTVQSYEKV